jgi:hypothetical protein
VPNDQRLPSGSPGRALAVLLIDDPPVDDLLIGGPSG